MEICVDTRCSLDVSVIEMVFGDVDERKNITQFKGVKQPRTNAIQTQPQSTYTESKRTMDVIIYQGKTELAVVS